ncbi:MAG: hypothetical protein KDC38_00225 [Planctomycetes bacterium]|nr:hypothetical protein [Planctomycetota bacterium]
MLHSAPPRRGERPQHAVRASAGASSALVLSIGIAAVIWTIGLSKDRSEGHTCGDHRDCVEPRPSAEVVLVRAPGGRIRVDVRSSMTTAGTIEIVEPVELAFEGGDRNRALTLSSTESKATLWIPPTDDEVIVRWIGHDDAGRPIEARDARLGEATPRPKSPTPAGTRIAVRLPQPNGRSVVEYMTAEQAMARGLEPLVTNDGRRR